jgi:hypothetical protein
LKVKGHYPLGDEARLQCQRVAKKGLGAATVVLVVFLGFAATPLRPSNPNGALAFDAFGIFLLFWTIQSYSRAVAVVRLELSRSAKTPAEVMAALLPFATPGFLGKSRFDRTGEAHYLLAKAAKKLGEDQVVAYCKAFVLRFRRGEFSDKIRNL